MVAGLILKRDAAYLKQRRAHRCSWHDTSGSGRLVERETENEIAPGLPVRVEIERAVYTAFECLSHDEIQSVQMRNLIARDIAADKVRKFALDTLGRERAPEQLIVGRVINPDIDVRG